MNATLQTLRAIPELSDALFKYSGDLGNMLADPQHSIAVALRDLFLMLKSTGGAANPVLFLQILRAVHPQFAQQQNGQFSQQDAEECWGQVGRDVPRACVRG